MEKRRINALARQECERVNEYGRVQARKTGDFESRPWLHPDEWARLRPSIVIIKFLCVDDGIVTDSEQKILSDWINEWMSRSRWGEFYWEQKGKAIQLLIDILDPSFESFLESTEYCATHYSNSQIDRLINCGDAIADEGIELVKTTWEIAKDTLITWKDFRNEI
ncbi:MAG: hypothetical protein IPN84_14820 [Sphingomonadales bacterium]|nr:hypothetical protein [Sphingomonadales bacterium]